MKLSARNKQKNNWPLCEIFVTTFLTYVSIVMSTKRDPTSLEDFLAQDDSDDDSDDSIGKKYKQKGGNKSKSNAAANSSGAAAKKPTPAASAHHNNNPYGAKSSAINHINNNNNNAKRNTTAIANGNAAAPASKTATTTTIIPSTSSIIRGQVNHNVHFQSSTNSLDDSLSTIASEDLQPSPPRIPQPIPSKTTTTNSSTTAGNQNDTSTLYRHTANLQFDASDSFEKSMFEDPKTLVKFLTI